MSADIKCVDLFCGCGGMSLGFEKAGFTVSAGFDNWKPAIKVYQKNFSHPVIEQDLSDVEATIELVREYNPTTIFGGPPCQDFSTAGFQDESRGRAALSICFSEVVCAVKPQYFVMENVATIRNTESFRKVISNFRNAGYGLTQKILNAAYCGVPQTRKRMFVIGGLDEQDDFLLQELEQRLLRTSSPPESFAGTAGDFSDGRFGTRLMPTKTTSGSATRNTVSSRNAELRI